MLRKNWTLADTAICTVGAFIGFILGAIVGTIFAMGVSIDYPSAAHWHIVMVFSVPVFYGAILGATVFHKKM